MANHVGKIKENLGHIIKEEISRRVNKKKSKKRTCYECHEYGHFGKECPTLHNEAHSSSRGTSTSPDSHLCLMARESKVSPTLTTNTSSNDDDNDDDNDNHNEYNNLLRDMGLVYASLCGNKEARASLEHSMETMNGYKETIGELESYIENSRMRFNLLKQELSNEKRNTFLLTQKIESYEVEKENILMMLVLLTLIFVKHLH
jgi:hypothetical protein